MKQLLAQGILYLIFAVVVAGASLVFAFMVIGVIVSAISNLAMFPLFAAMFFGWDLSFFQILGIGALMLVIIIVGSHFAPDRTESIIETFAMIFVAGLYSLMFLGLFGFPIFLVVENLFDIDLPGWAVLPIGLVTIISVPILSNMFSGKRKSGQ